MPFWKSDNEKFDQDMQEYNKQQHLAGEVAKRVTAAMRVKSEKASKRKPYSKIALALGEFIIKKTVEMGATEDGVLDLMQSGDSEFIVETRDYALTLAHQVRYRERFTTNPASRKLVSMLKAYRKKSQYNCLHAKDEIETVQMSLRLYKALKWLGINTVGELKHVHEHIQRSTARNNNIPRLGKKTRIELWVIANNLF